MPSPHRVVITGLGVICPAGNSLESCWETYVSGRSALSRITLFDLTPFPISIGGQVDEALLKGEEDFDPGVDRALVLAKIAARKALIDGGFDIAERKPMALSIGSGVGPSHALEAAYGTFFKKGWRGLAPSTVTRSMSSSLSAHISIDFQLTGGQATINSACSSANMAMTRAADLIRLGRESIVLTGGAEAPLCPSLFSPWVAMRVMADSKDPQKCMLPFNARRRGFSLSEGAAFFVFEDLDHARARGAKIYAEVIGYGESSDASHITKPNETSQAVALTAAMRDADINPGDVDYINAHGTGTVANDSTETNAIKIALGDAARTVAISSTKSVIGHSLGACGAIELTAVIGAFQNQVLPPTANLTERDPNCDLDYVPCEPRPARIDVALSNSFAFGGANSVIVLRRWEPQ